MRCGYQRPDKAGCRRIFASAVRRYWKTKCSCCRSNILSYFLRPESAEPTNAEKMGGFTLGMLAASLFIGAACSGFCGYITMVVSAQANVRVTRPRAARGESPCSLFPWRCIQRCFGHCDVHRRDFFAVHYDIFHVWQWKQITALICYCS